MSCFSVFVKASMRFSLVASVLMSRPFSVWVMISFVPGQSANPIQGRPWAMASAVARPKLSYFEGSAKICAFWYSFSICAVAPGRWMRSCRFVWWISVWRSSRNSPSPMIRKSQSG